MTENHSFGCIEDQIAMGLHDMSKAHVYQKPKEMTEELKEKFRELFPEYTVKDSEICLSPYIDIFEEGIEIVTKELQEELKHKKIAIQTRKARIKELEKQIEKMKNRWNCKNNNGYCVSSICPCKDKWELKEN